jgi:peptide deformylase
MLVLFPDERLRQVSASVDPSFVVAPILEDMFKVMYEHKGVGLSAIQIGIPLRIVVVDVGAGREVYINPKIERLGGTKELMKEGCLSFPGVWEDVSRSRKITISYRSLDGIDLTLNTSGFN